MSKLPELLPGRKIKKMIAAVVAAQDEIVREIQRVDAAIDNLPPGKDKRRLRAEHDELKRQIGLLPEPAPSPRNNWSSQKFAAKAVELKDAARTWKAAGRLDKANICLREARAAESEAALRRVAERKNP